MAIYSYVPFSDAKQELANRLYDSSMVFWTSTELGKYIHEALHTFNALTGYWRGDFTFTPQPNITWYDITQLPNSLRPYTLFDTNIYLDIQYALLEPAVGVNPWTGVSKQFTADDIINAVQRRRDELLSIASCTITRRLVPAVAGRTFLPDTVIDVRRICYLPAGSLAGYGSGAYGMGLYGVSIPSPQQPTVVWPEDTWGEQSFRRNYTLNPAGIPSTYLMSTQPPISFDTNRPPAYSGQYELLTTEAGAALSPATPTTLSVPDDWAHLIKWGALADLLSRDSNAQDLPRAAYCEQRYHMGIEILAKAPALLAMQMNNVPMEIDSVRAADLYNTSWEAQPPAPPTAAYHAGLNMLALAPVPDGGTYSALITVVQNAPVPIAATDPVQVSRDDYDVMLDYAQHLASFKMGGQEFLGTLPLLKRFLQQAAGYGLKLAELGEYTSALYELSQRENHMNPVAAPAPVEAD